VKPFTFQKFQIRQSKNVFRVGTDGVLLGALANVNAAERVLEVGTGTGLISLMLAQRNSTAEFLGIDINEEAIHLTRINFENSPFSSRMNKRLQDFKNFETPEKFDLIVSNPPYFEESDSVKDKLARQTIELNFGQLIAKSSVLLSENGIFSVIIPSDMGEEFIELAGKNALCLVRKIHIKGIETAKVKRLILEFSLKKDPLQESELVIEKSPRNYSDQYLEFTKEFHVFN